MQVDDPGEQVQVTQVDDPGDSSSVYSALLRSKATFNSDNDDAGAVDPDPASRKKLRRKKGVVRPGSGSSSSEDDENETNVNLSGFLFFYFLFKRPAYKRTHFHHSTNIYLMLV